MDRERTEMEQRSLINVKKAFREEKGNEYRGESCSQLIVLLFFTTERCSGALVRMSMTCVIIVLQ
jgi:hypothetical protein